jgi:hypothetical protein
LRHASAVLEDCSDAKEVKAMASPDGLQFLHAPRDFHMIDVKRILRYLCHTAQFGLHLLSTPSTVLAAFFDTDWVGSPNDRRSTGDMLYFFLTKFYRLKCSSNCIS